MILILALGIKPSLGSINQQKKMILHALPLLDSKKHTEANLLSQDNLKKLKQARFLRWNIKPKMTDQKEKRE